MALEVADGFDCPVGVVSVSVGVLAYGDGVCGAEGYASLAVNAVFVFADYGVGFWVVAVTVVGALVGAYFAADAASGVAFDEVFGVDVAFHFIVPPVLKFFSRAITGSPPRGHQNRSSWGETSRIAASSEEMNV